MLLCSIVIQVGFVYTIEVYIYIVLQHLWKEPIDVFDFCSSSKTDKYDIRYCAFYLFRAKNCCVSPEYVDVRASPFCCAHLQIEEVISRYYLQLN